MGYVLCACLKTFGMTTLDDQPSVDLINSLKLYVFGHKLKMSENPCRLSLANVS